MSEVTRILQSIESGQRQSAAELLPLVYEELRKLAAARMAQESPGQTLSATALVHEAYVRLVDTDQARRWDSRAHFFAAAGEAMRRILVERARAKQRQKRGSDMTRLDVEQVQPADETQPDLVIAVNDVLETLAEEDDRLAMLVKLRFFVGFSLSEAAEAMGIGRSTAYEHWIYAKSRLRVLMDTRK